jgi:hypothetical protein
MFADLLELEHEDQATKPENSNRKKRNLQHPIKFTFVLSISCLRLLD